MCIICQHNLINKWKIFYRLLRALAVIISFFIIFIAVFGIDLEEKLCYTRFIKYSKSKEAFYEKLYELF